jgi:hypothetical protein
MCNPEKNIIFWEARINPKALDITLENKSVKENNLILSLYSIDREFNLDS